MLKGKTKILEKIKGRYSQENLLIFSITFGILVLSLGVYLVGLHIPIGSTILILGSSILYVSIIVFVFLFA